jgi:hypothetical protein
MTCHCRLPSIASPTIFPFVSPSRSTRDRRSLPVPLVWSKGWRSVCGRSAFGQRTLWGSIGVEVLGRQHIMRCLPKWDAERGGGDRSEEGTNGCLFTESSFTSTDFQLTPKPYFSTS